MIRVAVIGAGHWGPNLIRNFYNHPDCEVAWVVDRDESRLEHIKQHYKGVATTCDAGRAIADKSVDAVAVVTPAATHVELAAAALAAGKHVFVEKPLAQSADEAAFLCLNAKTRERILMVGHVFVHNRAVQAAKGYIDRGELGKVFYINMERTNLGLLRRDVNVMWDVGTHDISIANYWLGAQPEAVSAHGGSWINQSPQEVIFATLFYPGDVLVNLHVSWLNPKKVREATVVGSQKMLVFNDMSIDEPIRIHDKGIADEPADSFSDTFASFRSSIREGDIVTPRVSTGEPLRDEVVDFLEAIRDSREPLTPGTNAVGVIRVLEAIDRSLDHGGQQESVS